MRSEKNRTRVLHVMLLALTLGLSIFAVSNLFSILLSTALGPISLVDELLAFAYLFIAVGTILLLARAIYRVDKRAGRIRNRVGWFE